MTNVILCGGSGTRLWPISRKFFPKQFYKLLDNMSLFQMTVLRNRDFCGDFLIVTNKNQYFIALDQLEEIGVKNYRFILEPAGRNTAAAIALSCFDAVKNQNKNDILFITPSDHLIKNQNSYKRAVEIAQKSAKDGNIVMFGIKPSSPETGYGYIEVILNKSESNLINDKHVPDKNILSNLNTLDDINLHEDVFSIGFFKEKPDKETACRYLSSGNFYWNSGMFMFTPEVLLKELGAICPGIYESSNIAYENAKKDGSMLRILENDMLNIEENSIDFALLEKTPMVKAILADIEWSDLGSFDSLYDEFKKDENNNAVLKDALNINSKNNLIMSSSRMVATIDIEDLIVIDTDDALLIAKRGSSQNVKKVVEELKKSNSELHAQHMTVHRPWGSYTVLLESSLYKIKKIVVKPGAKLSLQKHFHRSEHWIVTSGTALITVDDKTVLLKANESTYIPIGSIHRLENPGLIPLVLIEAQVGEYLKEDDIVRLEDDYHRMD
ncbi:MAG: mannose-1-phosphate guanylyltransferase/mannose-6-phosphate isomerase [Deltaproteobacteria bacterium]|nr:mannose-1-phosphate guanylyltransferase/mannose-6-phosphate isomerase [Deltaproteobacteria bacterium]MCL5880261.1 mannose-1-phosphate guanylyltransferase/mannose-6-phosphate isomerase [Deltaproteobacteria bacterium]MDA8303575.1 mannose-1-phosphate guanylyltransferase/mannose-6-phosphate isomerase [Deltaproteobacteria bacterium]